MQKSGFYVSFGIWLLVLPFLGIPGSWRNALVLASGILLLLVALWPSIMQWLEPAKPKRRGRKKAAQSSEITPPPQNPEI